MLWCKISCPFSALVTAYSNNIHLYRKISVVCQRTPSIDYAAACEFGQVATKVAVLWFVLCCHHESGLYEHDFKLPFSCALLIFKHLSTLYSCFMLHENSSVGVKDTVQRQCTDLTSEEKARRYSMVYVIICNQK